MIRPGDSEDTSQFTLITTDRGGVIPQPDKGSIGLLSIRRLTFVKFSDGERYPLMIENSGRPHWYATIFITTQARNSCKAPNTLLAMLASIRILLVWAESLSICLEHRFASGDVLREAEIESLRNFSQFRRTSASPGSAKVIVLSRRLEGSRARLHKADDRVAGTSQYIRLTYMANYLDWLGARLVEGEAPEARSEALRRIREMTSSIRLLRPQKRTSLLSARKGLSEEAQERLEDLVRPGSAANPFTPSLQQRNEVAVLLPRNLGIRKGELAALKVTDFDFQRNEVVVPRRHGDPSDPRTDQPVAKTLDRRIAVEASLLTSVFNYVMDDRSKFPAAKKHSFLLVTHQPGPFQGKPLSIKGLTKVFKRIQIAEPGLLDGFTAHVLRHTTNDKISEICEKQGVSEADEEKLRSYQMGWKEGSGTAATYTRRHTEKKAREVSLKLQQGWKRKKANDKSA